MSPSDNDPSVFNEPHLRGGDFAPDPIDERADQILSGRPPSEEEHVDQSVWDEPGLSPPLAGPTPEDAPTYEDWISRKIDETTMHGSWLTTIGLALAAGPWAVLGALMSSGGGSTIGVVMLTIIGPLTEEVMKSAAVLWAIERRPYLFQSRLQIFIALACGAFGFAAIENFVYLTIYIPDPSVEIIAWRWTVCVALHVGCTILSAMGLARIWHDSVESRKRPNLTIWFPYLMCAAGVHGTYNGFALIFETFVGF